MLSYNFKYELKQLLRSNWIQLLSVMLLLLFAFAIYNGNGKVKKRKTDISHAINEQQENDQLMLNLPMAFIAIGQSDLFTHYIKPTVAGDDFALNFTEMTSPVQLLFGSFDIAFVLVYLIPLIIIAFSYNILSAERESGSLKLLASQPINLRIWLMQKLSIRFFWLFVLVITSLTLLMLIFGLNPLKNITSYVSLLGLTVAYMLFWFALVFIVNIFIGNSAKNALSLLGLWIFFVLLTPSILNQLSSTLYPVPSRNLMINNMRSLKIEVTKKQDEILDNYLRDHPEYAINDSTQTRNFHHRYMASQKLLKEELQPEVSRFEEQLTKQQNWIDTFKWISPAIIAQESLNKIAGTSSIDYEEYRQQVLGFSNEWRNHFMPLLYNNEVFTLNNYKELPEFKYKISSKSNSGVILILLFISVGGFGLGFISSKGLKKSALTIK